MLAKNRSLCSLSDNLLLRQAFLEFCIFHFFLSIAMKVQHIVPGNRQIGDVLYNRLKFLQNCEYKILYPKKSKYGLCHVKCLNYY